jgi:phosphate transport system permease protein
VNNHHQAPAPTHRFKKSGYSLEKAIRFFFASNAGLTIVILGLIIVFLLKEGLGFFPGYRRELEIYRIAGLEFVDLSRKNLTTHEKLTSLLNRAYFSQINSACAQELKRYEEASALSNAYADKISATRDLVVNQSSIDSQSPLYQKLFQQFNQQKEQALLSLPLTPHLTTEERQSLLSALRERAADVTDDPPFLTQLAEAYTQAQTKHAEPLQNVRTTIDSFSSASSDLSAVISQMSEQAKTTKSQLDKADILQRNRATLLAAVANTKDPAQREKLTTEAEASLAEKPDTEGPLKALLENRPASLSAHEKLKAALKEISPQLPKQLDDPKANQLLQTVHRALPLFITELDQAPTELQAWKPDEAVPLSRAIGLFLTGKDWITGGEWQDFYGILPLLIGSLMISILALLIAVPFGIGAAIYVNQFASPREQTIIKPIIEFIQAIPSVVLGFIGIFVFGTVLRDLSIKESLSWMPGFPIDERLNIFTAACLLALMSIPTIFSLAEDAINNVPSAYSEASEALGATRLQTAFRVIIPAAFSGILAAILLGFGRVIGETMVVLLVAGNRIKIPDFSSGIGAFFQPSHTLTGIIAQELGEVPVGSVHYRALFVIGILLFVLVLIINATAHHFVRKMKH